MLYTRNKDCFKKTTAKVEHNQARKSIINMVKQTIGKDSFARVSGFDSQSSTENKCTNSQIQEFDEITLQRHDIMKPSMANSRASSIAQSNKNQKKPMKIDHVIGFTLKNDSNIKNVDQSRKEYIKILQAKIENLQQQISEQKSKVIKLSKSNEKQIYEYELERLNRFYHRARNVLIAQSVELLECKNSFLKQLQRNPIRLRALNGAICKGEQILEQYRKVQDRENNLKKLTENKEIDFMELKEICEYQQKTIDFLRKQNPFNSQFHQLKLLKHEIARVCNENENLILKLSQKSSKKPELHSSPIVLQNQNQNNKIEELKQIIKEMTDQLKKVNTLYQNEQDQTFKLREQKQFLGSLLDEARTKQEFFEVQSQKYEKQIHNLKVERVKAESFELNNQKIATTEDLCRQLKAYPKYFTLFMAIINDYQLKINELQNQFCSQREQKEKFMKWSTEVYHLLQTANISEQILQKHKQQLYSVDSNLNSRVQKHLKQILALSIGIDCTEMEAQLQQYVITLKNRNQVIKQVDIQDGSSVAISESCKDQDFE